MSVEAAAHDRAKYLLTIKRNERSPSREIAAHNQRNVHRRQGAGSSLRSQSRSNAPARFNRDRSLVQLSGRKRRNATITGTSPRASVSDTRVWQLAFLPRAEAYWSVRHEPPGSRDVAASEGRRQPRVEGKCDNVRGVGVQQRVFYYMKCVRLAFEVSKTGPISSACRIPCGDDSRPNPRAAS